MEPPYSPAPVEGRSAIPSYLFPSASPYNAPTTPSAYDRRRTPGPASASMMATPSADEPRTGPRRSARRLDINSVYDRLETPSRESKQQALPSPTAADRIAPPVESLYDVMSPVGASTRERPAERNTSAGVERDTMPSRLDPFYTESSLHADDKFDDRWVTIFGFAPSQVAFVLRHFQTYGEITKHEIGEAGGNWMHVQFQDRLYAQIALAKNGKVIGGNLMVGVVPCIARSAMQDASAPAPQVFAHQSYAGALRQFEADPFRARDVPVADNSIMSKFLEYVLGL